MKKLILTFAAAACCLLSAEAQTRTALYQEFTGENCGPCAAENPGLEALMAATGNAAKVIHITNMEPVPSSGFFYMSQQTINDACMGRYSPTWTSFGGYEYTPFGFLDGYLPDSTTGSSIPCGNCGSIGSLTQTDIDNEAAKPAPVMISASHYFTAAHDSVYGKVIVKAVSPIGGAQLKMRVAYVKTMNFTSPPGSNGEKHFENVVRNMYPNEAGQSVAAAWTTGSTATYTYAGKISGLEGSMSGISIADSNIVVWIQNDSVNNNDRFVLQAAKSIYSPGFKSLEVNSVTPSMEMSIYPNPAKEIATVSFSLAQGSDVHVRIIDELGRVNSTITKSLGAGDQRVELSTKELPAGTYSVQMQVNNDVVTERLSVIK